MTSTSAVSPLLEKSSIINGNRPKLRDHILDALSTLPGTRSFHLHVLQSSPRKNNTLFPFVKPKIPRAYLQDILVLLSESKGGVDDEDGDEEGKKRVLVSAMEVQVYHVPNTDCGIVYVGKVDSTGQGSGPNPTAAMVRAVIGFYCDPTTRPITATHIWVQLFARAQGQYLFPNSKEWQGKKWLNDTQLCAWWKRILTRVAMDVEGKGKEKEKMKTKMYYVLPGYSAFEAENTLRIAARGQTPVQGPLSVQWEYGHPYAQTDIPLPCPRPSNGYENLGYYIPYFDDDPKSRFMDEIAHTTEDGAIQNPQPKKRMKMMRVESQKRLEMEKEKEKETEKEDPDRPNGDLSKVTPEEFWERMSFRQECVAGAVTGFFALGVSCASSAPDGSPLAPQPGQVSSLMNKRVMTSLTTGSDFGNREQSIKSTETLEKAIRGLCQGIPLTSSVPARSTTPPPRLLAPPSTPPRRGMALPDVSPNPFPEPIASLDTYTEYIYGTVKTANKEVDTKNSGVEHVQVLSVRKKKKSKVGQEQGEIGFKK